MRLNRFHIAVGVALLAGSTPAAALQHFAGHVTSMEITYMPSSIRFTLDQGNAACPVNKQLAWISSNPESTKAVSAALTTAMVSGLRIDFFIDDNDTSCVGKFVYLVP